MDSIPFAQSSLLALGAVEVAGFRSAPQPQSSRLSTGQCLVAGFDTVRSIVAARAWSALAARFALTNSGRYRLQLPATSIVATIHRTDRSFRLRKPPTEFPPPEALGGFPHGLTGLRVRILASICKIPDTRKGHPGFCVEVAGFSRFACPQTQ